MIDEMSVPPDPEQQPNSGVFDFEAALTAIRGSVCGPCRDDVAVSAAKTRSCLLH
jgi:hypothetical protein